MKSKTKKWVGIALVVFPLPMLVITMIAYAVASFVFSSLGADPATVGATASSGELRVLIGNLVNVGLGLIGFISVLGIFIAIPIGIILLVRSDDARTSEDKVKDLKKNPHYNS
jgi:hypothetical protein